MAIVIFLSGSWFPVFRRYFGQPVANTHPHLIHEGDVTPGLSKWEYEQRRTKLMNLIHQKTSESLVNHIVLIPSATLCYMSYNIPYTFRQNSEFLYLSGFQEPDSLLILETTENGYKSVLFVPKRDPDREVWDGPRSGDKGAVTVTGVTEAHGTEQLENYLYQYCKTHSDYIIWYQMAKPAHAQFHKSVIQDFLKQDGKKVIQNPLFMLHHLRVRKSSAEIELMKKTTAIASRAFVEVMKFSHPDVSKNKDLYEETYICFH